MIRIPFLGRDRDTETRVPEAAVEHVAAVPVRDAAQLLASSSVLVTGAGPNIGGSIAEEVARHGAGVYCTDVDGAVLAALVQRLAPFAATCETFESDVSKADDVDSLVRALDDRGVHIDTLVNNVGVELDTKEIEDIAIDAVFLKVFQANVFGPMRLTNAIAERMVKRGQGGSIIFVSSIHQWSISRNASYSASKAALGMIVREMAVKWGPHGIRVNAIAPGWIDQDASGQPRRHDPTPLRQSSIPPAIIGRAVVHLASEYFSRYTTGTTITVDAGLSLKNYLTK